MLALQEGGHSTGKVSSGKQRSFQMTWALWASLSSCSGEIHRCADEEHVPAHGAAGGCAAGVPRPRGVHLLPFICPTEKVLWLLLWWWAEVSPHLSEKHHSAGVLRFFIHTHFLSAFTFFFIILLLTSSGEADFHDVVPGGGTHVYRTSSMWMQVSLTSTKSSYPFINQILKLVWLLYRATKKPKNIEWSVSMFCFFFCFLINRIWAHWYWWSVLLFMLSSKKIMKSGPQMKKKEKKARRCRK